MLRCFILLCLLYDINNSVQAQTPQDSRGTDSSYLPSYMAKKTKYISILTGYNFWHYHYAELGIAAHSEGNIGHHPFASAAFLSCEARIDKQPMIGPKIGGWFGNGLAMGLNMIYYTNFEQASLRLRPEIGIGTGPFKLVYGYNFALTNSHFEGVNKNVISISYLINVKKGKTISW